MLNRRALITALPLAALVGACARPGDALTTVPSVAPAAVRSPVVDPLADLDIKTSGFKALTSVPDGHRPWRHRLARRVDDGIRDRTQVRMFRWNGKLYNHPVGQAQYGLQNLASYRRSGEQLYLDRAILQAERLASERVEERGASYYPYPFDYAHTTHRGLTFKAPWYSGMAQGEVLSLFSQLAAMPELGSSERQRYRDLADRTFVSLRLTDTADPWVVNVDRGFYWIQEYPVLSPGTPDYTYNGFMFAALGLWDYHHLTGDAAAASLFDASLTTLDAYYPELRNRGGASDYCLTHKLPAKGYHVVHIQLFAQFTQLTGDSRFAKHAAELKADGLA